MSMDNANVSDEHVLPEQPSAVEAQQNPNTMIELANLTNTVNDANKLVEPRRTRKSKKRFYYGMKRSHKAIIGSALVISIVMVIAIVTVCLTTPKANKSCQSSFYSAIDDSLIQNNSYPYSLTTGDFNHDNMLDIVVVNSDTNNIGIFINYGNGTFERQITFATGDQSRPVSVAVGDFNNDTRLDIVIANYDSHNIGIFLGYGNGTFASQIVFSVGISRPVSIAIGDLNNDQRLDIVVTNNGTNNIAIFFGYKNGSFGNPRTYFTGYDSLPSSVVINDIDNDHHLDIAVANYGTDNIGLFLGYGNESFTTPTTYSTHPRSSPSSIAMGDVNKDGQLDIAVANSGTNTVGIFLGNGNGTFLSQKTYSIFSGSRPHSIIIGHFDQDNLLDIAVSNSDTNNISILIGYGNGSFAIPTSHSTGINSDPLGMTAGDFDNNSQSDIAVVNSQTNNVLLLIGYTMMQSQNPTEYSTGNGSNSFQIGIGDFDNDTQLDLVVANSDTNNVGVFLGYGNGSFQEQVTYSTGYNSHPLGLIVSDLDNDQRLDIVVANSKSKSLGILYGYGNGTFDTVTTYFTGNVSSPRSVVVHDFNSDNHLDIAFADIGTNSIGVFLGYGNRNFGNLLIFPIGDGAHPCFVGTGDFNNDGQSDIAVANNGIDSIGIFLGFGNGTFILSSFYSTESASLPWRLAIADSNKDNCLDIPVC